MTKHTQGPWHVVIEDGNPVVKSLDDFYITNTIDAAGYESDNDTMFANARLIAAAPDMLEAMTHLLECCDESDGAQYGTMATSFIRKLLKDAIAKATGEKA